MSSMRFKGISMVTFRAIDIEPNSSASYQDISMVSCRSSVTNPLHTIYTRNNMSQKCEGNCGLWVLNEIIKKTYPENLKKIMGAVWELPAKQQSQSSPI